MRDYDRGYDEGKRASEKDPDDCHIDVQLTTVNLRRKTVHFTTPENTIAVPFRHNAGQETRPSPYPDRNALLCLALPQSGFWRDTKLAKTLTVKTQSERQARAIVAARKDAHKHLANSDTQSRTMADRRTDKEKAGRGGGHCRRGSPTFRRGSDLQATCLSQQDRSRWSDDR